MNTKIACFFGRHKWLRITTQPNGVGFLDECLHCGRGRFLAWAGHASTAGKLTKKELQAWHHEAKNPPIK